MKIKLWEWDKTQLKGKNKSFQDEKRGTEQTMLLKSMLLPQVL